MKLYESMKKAETFLACEGVFFAEKVPEMLGLTASNYFWIYI